MNKPICIDAYTTGWFDTFVEADEAIKELNHKRVVKIVREYD